MKYFTSKSIKQDKNTIVTIGKFDGVHKGHINILNKVKLLKEEKYKDCESVIFSFEPHPMSFILNKDFKVIFDSEERFEVFENLGIDVLIEYPFDNETKEMSPTSFIEDILIDKLNCKALVIGRDYNFGKNKEGTASMLKEILSDRGIEVVIEDEVLYFNEKLSSSRIRNYISSGDMETVNSLLNQNYFIKGEVVKCKQLGRTIGFPTMNVFPSKNKILPPYGVYISRVYIDNDTFNAITNIGVNPTVHGDILTVECHILNFNKDIYGKLVKIEILKKVRSEKKFSSLDELKNQINQDVEFTKKFFKI